LQPPALRRWDVLSHCLSVCHLQVAAGTGGIVIGAGKSAARLTIYFPRRRGVAFPLPALSCLLFTSE
jgi:hypothetical protein